MSNKVKNAKRFTSVQPGVKPVTVQERVVAFFFDPRKRSHVSQYASGRTVSHGF